MNYDSYLAEKKRYRPTKITVTIPADTIQTLKEHRKATKVPTSQYLAALIASDLDQNKSA